jgi:hypothetical protein
MERKTIMKKLIQKISRITLALLIVGYGVFAFTLADVTHAAGSTIGEHNLQCDSDEGRDSTSDCEDESCSNHTSCSSNSVLILWNEDEKYHTEKKVSPLKNLAVLKNSNIAPDPPPPKL